MRQLLLILWLGASGLLLVLAVVLAYMSVMMGALHWDWPLALGIGAGFAAVAVGGLWMCRQAYRLLKAR